MKWIDSTPDISARGLGEITRHVSLVDALKIVLYSLEKPFVLFNRKVNQQVIDHVSRSRLEQGGLLIGRVFSRKSLEEGVSVIHITNSVRCRDSESTGVSLSMGSDVWQVANSQLEDEEFVVGWYHSHPNLGAFFSGTDRNTQKSFFNNAYSLGLVIDPFRKERKWFLGPKCMEIEPNRIRNAEELTTPRSPRIILDHGLER